MSQRPNKPCRVRLCRAITRNANGYCDAHQDQASNWSKRPDKPGSTTQRGYGHKWRQLRAQVLKRDNHLCQCCRRAGRVTEAQEVDHIIAKAHGGSDLPSNLEAICRDCHRVKTAGEHGRRGSSKVGAAHQVGAKNSERGRGWVESPEPRDT